MSEEVKYFTAGNAAQKRKIIQIAVIDYSFNVLCDDGTIWYATRSDFKSNFDFKSNDVTWHLLDTSTVENAEVLDTEEDINIKT